VSGRLLARPSGKTIHVGEGVRKRLGHGRPSARFFSSLVSVPGGRIPGRREALERPADPLPFPTALSLDRPASVWEHSYQNSSFANPLRSTDVPTIVSVIKIIDKTSIKTIDGGRRPILSSARVFGRCCTLSAARRRALRLVPMRS
jgi:hypothetical protein